jgi:hypothetical protein
MTWQPGRRVLTDEDARAWRFWRNERKRQQQRDRRANSHRIDYYPSPMAHYAILARCGPFVGGDYSSVINRVIEEWAARLPPESILRK